MNNKNILSNAIRIGLGCMGMSEFYGETDDDNSLDILHAAYDLGYRHFDTADMYGKGHNERLIGTFVKELGSRSKDILIATKVGIKRDVNGPGTLVIDSTPKYIIQACEQSLNRLGVEQIDLYYLHRRNPDVPIEETMGAMKQLLDEGKIAAVGLSEVSTETLKQANSIVKVSALQSEYSLWSRDIEDSILPACNELNINLVAYSPIGRGFLSGTLKKEQVHHEGDLRGKLPRFQQESFENNQKLLDAVKHVADEKNCSLAQVALSWLLGQNPLVTVIPGARKLNHLIDNFASQDIHLSKEQISYLSEAFKPDNVSGYRYPEPLLKTTNT